ncbi:hypothetical protein Tco_1353509 [Tanacetum coccineum]
MVIVFLRYGDTDRVKYLFLQRIQEQLMMNSSCEIEIKQMEVDVLAIQHILHRSSEDILLLVIVVKLSQEIWVRVETNDERF